MALIKTKTLLLDAKKKGYAIGAFNVANMEMTMGTIRAAEELKSPIILQIAEARLNHSPLELIGPMMIDAAREANIPIAVHLDHGTTMNTIKKALDMGFKSVMIDGSLLKIEENITLTNEVINLSKKYDADVEAEIGVVGGSEDDSEDIKTRYTSTEDAYKFATSTHVDALAIAIGNAHGIYKSKPNLCIDILKKINNSIDTPLVLHGGSGLSEEDFKNCIKNGIHKINVATATFNSVVNNLKSNFSKKDTDYFKVHNLEIEGAYNSVKKHIKIFGSEGQANNFK